MPLFGWYSRRQCATDGCANTVPSFVQYCAGCRIRLQAEQRRAAEIDALFDQLYDWWDGVWLERHREFFDWRRLHGR
jgi:hypothetical protein